VDHFEVIVIGAGPAGAVAARDMARAGVRVALVDGSHPREKPCGGGVTRRALELVSGPGSSALRCDGRMVRTLRFETGSAGITVDLPDGYLDVFSRETFDRALTNAAREAGAVAIAARATALARTGSGWSVTAGGATLTARFLLGADGAGGLVRKQVTRPFDRSQLSIAAGSYVDGSDISEIVVRFVDEPRGYLWSFPRPGHLAVGTCAQADVTSTAKMHAITDRWLDAYVPARGLPRRRYAWPIPSLGAADLDREQPAGDGWLLLGDAAGLVDPITREGIFFALRSGMLAADALAATDPPRRYAEAVRDELHDELRRAARLKAGFFRPRFTSLLIDALRDSDAIRRVMVDLVAGRQTYRGLKRRLLGTLEVGLAARVLISPGTRHARGR
jgi:geranylgeranyl diphosphate/geranylgeranyl-bacteriochlorophyllide a reductase